MNFQFYPDLIYSYNFDHVNFQFYSKYLGLARSPAARQIMSKLPIFTNGELQTLVRGPVLQDKRTEHVKFQEYAMELIKKVSGPEGK